MPSSARRVDPRTLHAASVSDGRAVVPLPYITAGTLAWRWELAHGVVHEWRRWTERTCDLVSSAVRLVRPPGGRPVVVIDVALAGEPEPAAERLATLRRLEPEADAVRVRHPGAVRPASDPVPAGIDRLTAHRRLAELPAAAVDAFVAATGPSSGSPLLSAELHRVGGAYAMVAIGGGADLEEEERVRIWLAHLERRLAPWLAPAT